MNQIKKLYRARFNRILGGVCSGMADYFAIDPTLVRVLWVIFSIMGGAGVLAYIICWIIIPEAPYGT
jgi:phage shock protein C